MKMFLNVATKEIPLLGRLISIQEVSDNLSVCVLNLLPEVITPKSLVAKVL